MRALSNRPAAIRTQTPPTAPQPWIEQVAHRVAEHVETVNGNGQGKTGKESQVRAEGPACTRRSARVVSGLQDVKKSRGDGGTV